MSARHRQDIGRVALLQEPLRLRLFEYVRSRRDPVGRDEAAKAIGISRSLAAFHLDRLADAEMLETEYRRIGGRTGRGAGRPAKLYRVTSRRLEVSIPESRYRLGGAVLARSLVDLGPGERPRAAVRRTARQCGVELGRAAAQAGGSAGELRRAYRAVDDLGFQPRRRRDVIRMGNCPFRALVEENRELVCSMNHALLTGLVEGLGLPGVVAEPEPEAGACCVRLQAGAAAPGRRKGT